jgi:hypothetical protein
VSCDRSTTNVCPSHDDVRGKYRCAGWPRAIEPVAVA